MPIWLQKNFSVIFFYICAYYQPLRSPDFSALTLLVGWQEGHLAYKKVSGGRGYLLGARCTLAYGPADATATHSLLLQ